MALEPLLGPQPIDEDLRHLLHRGPFPGLVEPGFGLDRIEEDVERAVNQGSPKSSRPVSARARSSSTSLSSTGLSVRPVFRASAIAVLSMSMKRVREGGISARSVKWSCPAGGYATEFAKLPLSRKPVPPRCPLDGPRFHRDLP